jgi:hypothetical protein
VQAAAHTPDAERDPSFRRHRKLLLILLMQSAIHHFAASAN